MSALSYVPDRLDQDIGKSDFKIDMEKLYKDLIKQVAADETRRKEAKRSPAKHGAPAETILEVAGERAEDDDD